MSTLLSASTKLPIALFDWDGTVRPGFTVQSWCRYLVNQGLISQAVLDELAMLFERYEQGILSHDDLSAYTSKVYAQGLAGRNVADVTTAAQRFVMSDIDELFPYALTLFSRLPAAGISIVVVSGAPGEVLRAYQAHFPIDLVFGFELEVVAETGRYSGQVLMNSGVSMRKKAIIGDLLSWSRPVLAFGNSLSDLPLLRAAEYGFVINTDSRIFPDDLRPHLIFVPVEQIEALVLSCITQNLSMPEDDNA